MGFIMAGKAANIVQKKGDKSCIKISQISM